MKHIFTVEGMTCAHCEQAIQRALRRLDLSSEVVIERSQNKVEIESTVPASNLIEAIADAGYQVVV